MKRIKQINADPQYNLERPLNTFLNTLPRRGEEIIKITYLTTQGGIPASAMVEYEIN